MQNILSVKHLTKTFRSHWSWRTFVAIKDISFEVHTGECFGFLGHNGAGKTTTIKSILGLINKTAGEILFCDQPLTSATQRQTFGYLPEQPYFYEHLTVEETLSFFGALHNIGRKELRRRSSLLLEELGLDARRHTPVRALSKGLQQRLGIAQAIINEPQLLLLDEPFSGLDPVGRKEIRQLLTKLNKSGTTVFLSSHILSDVENMCERAAIIAHGELKTIVPLKGQETNWSETKFTLTLDQSEHLATFIAAQRESCTAVSYEHLVHSSSAQLQFSDYNLALKTLHEASTAGLRVISFQEMRPSLEDIFVSIVKGVKQ